jgi:beta-lactamase class A
MMMIWSDNTATDILIRKVGIENVEKRMRSFGLQDIFVNRTIKQLLIEYFGMDYARSKNLTPQEFAVSYKLFLEENPAAGVEAAGRYSRVLKDQATPRAINALLEGLFQEKILDPASCRLILAVMAECQTGVGRIRGLLPATVVAHKTGTVGGTVNDCGIITLPGDMGHIALSILSKDTDPGETESQISLIARCVYDFFCFSRPMMSNDGRILPQPRRAGDRVD